MTWSARRRRGGPSADAARRAPGRLPEVPDHGEEVWLEAPSALRDRLAWSGSPAGTGRTYVPCTRVRVPPDLGDVTVANMRGARVLDIDSGDHVNDESPPERAALLDAVTGVDG